ITSEVFKNSIKVRQAIAQSIVEIPSELKKDYESLLTDTSYVTIETALYNLWTNFPEERSVYLEETKHVIGMPNKNVRLLWLTLSLVTPDYAAEEKKAHLKELVAYTSPVYNYEIRMQAFSFLDNLKIVNDDVLKHYKEAEQHHNWRLKKFAQAFAQRNKENEK
ncbi:MAG: M1 family peptidase, partial [Oceanihabitans sp.]|nr:M1 family peptidase [Oceanihabitans sp.]